LIYKAERASIVYGRTYEVDFRFIELPEDFRAVSPSGFPIKEQGWIENHIRSSTLASEKLPKKPRWSIFKNEKYSVIGVTCMADEVADEKTKDREARPLYVFLGYVFRSIDLPIVPMELDSFKHLYRSISSRWEDKPFEQSSKEPMWSSYEEIYSDLSSNNSNVKPSLQLNLNPKKLFAWVDLEEFRRDLWAAGLNCQTPISICLGLPNKNTALKGNFLNGIILDLPSVTELSREPNEHSREYYSTDTHVSSSQTVPPDKQNKQPSQTVESHTKKQKTDTQTNCQTKDFDERHESTYEDEDMGILDEFKQFVIEKVEDFVKNIPRQSPSNNDGLEDEAIRDINDPPSISPKRRFGKQKPQKENISQNPSNGLDIGFKPKKAQQDDLENNKEWF